MDLIDPAKVKMTGHVLIRDPNSGEVLLNKKNAIHYENMSLAIAYSLAGRKEGNIYEMHFGNGGSTVSGTGAITYFPPNVTGATSDLYNPTYSKVVNDSLNPDSSQIATNFIEVRHLLNTTYTDIIVTCTLDYSEPAGQQAFDDETNASGDFVFNELGLKSYSSTGNSMLLTHVIFNPIQKSLNRLIEIIYTVRVQMG